MRSLASVVAAAEISPDGLTQALAAAVRLRGARVTELRTEPCGTGQRGDA